MFKKGKYVHVLLCAIDKLHQQILTIKIWRYYNALTAFIQGISSLNKITMYLVYIGILIFMAELYLV